MRRSPDDARLVVIGSASAFSDQVLAVSERAGSRDVAGNVALIANLADWAVEDTALLSIRARGAPRTLAIAADSQTRWEWANYGAALVGLVGVVLLGRIRRRGLDIQVSSPGRSSGTREPPGGSRSNTDDPKEAA